MPPKALSPFAVILLLASTTAARAQEPAAPPVLALGDGVHALAALPDDETDPPPEETPYLEQSSLFMERTRFGFRIEGMRAPDPAGNILFEGSPALHAFFWNPLSRHTAIRPGEKNHSDWPIAASLTFNPTVRMLAAGSEPVRAPSWKIRANLQYFWKHPQTHALKVDLTGMRLSFGHYSNGQEGCPFEQGKLESEDCAPFDYYGDPDLSLVNRRSGDFSLNHITLALHHRMITLAQLGKDRRKRRHMSEYRSHTFGLSVDRISSTGIGGISGELRALYGNWAFQGDYRFEHTLGAPAYLDSLARISLEAGAYAIAGGQAYPLRLWTEAAYTVPSWSDFGVFAQVFHGQDYYNLQFVDKVDYQVLFGFVIDLHPRPRHACIEHDNAACRVPEAKPSS